MTPHLRWGLASDVGRVRKENQDRSVATGRLFAVADGMGGHAGGATAAQVAVETLQATFEAAPSATGLHGAIRAANEAILERAKEDRSLHGMGTTLTALALVDNGDGSEVLHLVNVGDSRAYLLREGDLFQLTEDHSMVEEMVRAGELSPDEAASHPARHVLTRVLGVDPEVTPDAWEIELHEGDRILLCSDGLVNEVDDDSIAAILEADPDPDEAARALVETARANGGSDNITVVVVDITAESTDLVAAAPTGAGIATSESTAGEAVVRSSREGGLAPSAGSPDGATSAADLASSDLGETPSPTREEVGPGEECRDEWDASPAELDASPAELVVPEVAPAPPHALEPGPIPRWDAGAAMTLVGAGSGGGNLFVPAPDTAAGPARRSHRRRTHRRPAQLPRRALTVRTLAFVLLLLLVVAGAVVSVEIYAARSWYVTVHDTHLVVEQGQPGGVLWVRPKVVEVSSLTTAHVEPYHLAKLRAGIPVANLGAANQLIADLRSEYQSLHPADPRSGAAGVGSAPATTTPGGAGSASTSTTTSTTGAGSASSSATGAGTSSPGTTASGGG